MKLGSLFFQASRKQWGLTLTLNKLDIFSSARSSSHSSSDPRFQRAVDFLLTSYHIDSHRALLPKGVSDIITWVSFFVFLHYLENIVYRDIKAISRDFIQYFWSNYKVVFNCRPLNHTLFLKIYFWRLDNIIPM